MTTRLDYCRYLLSTQINFTITNYVNHFPEFSHDSINWYLVEEKMSGRIIWEHVKGAINHSPRGCVVFDDSILVKNHSHSIDLVRRQYSGNAHGLIKGSRFRNRLLINPTKGCSYSAFRKSTCKHFTGSWKTCSTTTNYFHEIHPSLSNLKSGAGNGRTLLRSWLPPLDPYVPCHQAIRLRVIQ